jgi:hypothetical protein
MPGLQLQVRDSCPSSSTRTGLPRNDGGGFHLSSGYWRVNFGRNICLIVILIPLIISGKYNFCQKFKSCAFVVVLVTIAINYFHPKNNIASEVTIILAIESGSIHFQPRSINWSYRKRGTVHRIITMNKITAATLNTNVPT